MFMRSPPTSKMPLLDKKTTMLSDMAYGNVEMAEGALELQMRAVQSGACEKVGLKKVKLKPF